MINHEAIFEQADGRSPRIICCGAGCYASSEPGDGLHDFWVSVNVNGGEHQTRARIQHQRNMDFTVALLGDYDRCSINPYAVVNPFANAVDGDDRNLGLNFDEALRVHRDLFEKYNGI